jgi:hypothetical protein
VARLVTWSQVDYVRWASVFCPMLKIPRYWVRRFCHISGNGICDTGDSVPTSRRQIGRKRRFLVKQQPRRQEAATKVTFFIVWRFTAQTIVYVDPAETRGNPSLRLSISEPDSHRRDSTGETNLLSCINWQPWCHAAKESKRPCTCRAEGRLPFWLGTDDRLPGIHVGARDAFAGTCTTGRAPHRPRTSIWQ